MAKPRLNLHKGKKSYHTVRDVRITSRTDVRNSPFKDRDNPSIKLDAKKAAAKVGSIDLEHSGRGASSGLQGLDDGVDGKLVVTLTSPVIDLPTDVTYIDDPGAVAATMAKPGKKKPAKKAPIKKTTAQARGATKASKSKTRK